MTNKWMLMSVIGMALSLFLSLSEKVHSGESDLMPSVRINAVIDLDERSGIYRYSYSISTPDSNTGESWVIDFDPLSSDDSKRISDMGTSNGFRLTERDSNRIRPGGEPGGYEMFSRGLPGVRTIYIKPKSKVKSLEGATMAGIERVASMRKGIVVSVESIGPAAAPAEFIALDFLYHIRSLQQEAEELGWITSIGVGSSLDGKLNNVRKKLQFGNTKAAAHILNAFIHEVEAQGCATYDDCPKGRHLSPEAWALLKFNAEYLLRRL